MKKPKSTPEQRKFIELMELALELTKAVIDFQNVAKESKPKPPEPGTVVSYKAKYLRMKFKVSKGILNLFNIKKA